jgi:cell division protein FtsW
MTANSSSRLDAPLLFAVMALLVIGLIMVASTSAEHASEQYGHWWFLLWRHAQHICVAVLCAWIAFMVPMRFWHASAPLLFPLGLLSLLLLLAPGMAREVGGAKRWLDIAGLPVQPSEMIKLLGVMYLARLLVAESKVSHSGETRRALAYPVILFMALSCLLLEQPDMGTLMLMLCCGMLMLFLAGIRLRVFAGLSVLLMTACTLLIVFSPYRWQRVVAFLDPWQDAMGSGYQLSHALSAFGSGGLWGVGLGHSMQKQFYLPAAHTDFIFAVIAEEFGFLGVAFVIGLFCYLVIRMWRVATMARLLERPFTMYLAYGLCFLMAMQTFINLGVNLGVLPTKGITLPFISYGGSSLVSSCVLCALMLRAHWELCTAHPHPGQGRY